MVWESKYDTRIPKLAKKYIESCEDVWKEVDGTTPTNGFMEKKVKLPTLVGFVIFLAEHDIKVDESTLRAWRTGDYIAKKYGEDEYNELVYWTGLIKSHQKQRLIDSGLGKNYDARISTFLLKVNHNMKEEEKVNEQDEDRVIEEVIIEAPSDGA